MLDTVHFPFGLGGSYRPTTSSASLSSDASLTDQFPDLSFDITNYCHPLESDIMWGSPDFCLYVQPLECHVQLGSTSAAHRNHGKNQRIRIVPLCEYSEAWPSEHRVQSALWSQHRAQLQCLLCGLSIELS